jgi:hypothetical protein
LSKHDIDRKKPEHVAFLNDLLLKIGWYHVGSLLSANIPNTVKNAVNNMVNSNVTGMNAGSDMNGLPDRGIL